MRRKLWLPVLLVLCLALTVGMLVACDPGSSDQGGQGGNEVPDDAPRRTVTFDLNGGSGSISPMEFAVGYAMSGLPEPTRKGYDFLGWQDINGNMYDETTKMPDQDLKLYAYWQIIVTSYSDNYVSFKPATEGVKDSGTRYDYDLIDTFIYVELTSSDLGGRGNVGDRNNFDFSKGVNIEYSAKDGYTLQWYSDSDFTVLNGAQVFTLYYGSNFQFLTVSSGQSVVKRYLVDFYVLHDYEVKLHKSIHHDGYYDTVYVVENRTFPASTEAYQLKDFEFDKRVYWNATTGEWRAFNYSTPITGDLDLYQTYKPKTVTADLDGGTLSEPLTVRPYVQYQRLPVPTKEGYDFIGWQLPDAEDDMTDYFSDITGFVSTQMLGEGGSSSGGDTYFTSLKAVWKPKQFAMLKDGDTVSFKATVPVVTYTDLTLADINEILYVPYGTDCVVPDKIDYTGGGEFRGWKTYTDDDLADDPYLTEETPPETPGEDIPPDDPVIDPGDPVIDPDDPVIDPDDPVVPGDPGTTPSQGTVVLDGDRFDFGTEVTSPIALYQVMAYNLEFTGTKLQLNNTVTLSSRMNMRALLPAKGTYTFEFTARSGGDVTFSYGGTSYHVTASSPKTVIVTNSSSTKGQVVVFTVSSLYGKVDVAMSGPTATTTGSPIDIDPAALYDLGEEVTLTAPDKAGYDCIGWYDGDTRVCESGEYTFTLTGEAAFTPEYEWNNELQNFEYIEKADGTVTITGVKSSVAAQLQALVIPEYVVTINSGAFNSATNLVSIEVEEGNTAFSSAGGILYDKEQKNIVYVPAKLAGSVTLPDGLQSVKSSAFSGRSLVTSVTIPSSVTSIGSYAFEDCAAEVIWGGTPTITEIGRYAFAGYAGTSITIPSSVTSIGSNAFSGCSSLESMTIPFVGAEAGKTAEDIYQYPFGYIFGTSSYTGGTAVRQTYYGSSTSSTTSTTYYIPSSLRSVTVTGGNILRGAFSNCSMLTSVTISDSMTSIGSSAFEGCTSLTSVTIGKCVTSIGTYAFDGCAAEIIWDGTPTITEIGGYAFAGYAGTSITIPSSVTSIGSYAFQDCTAKIIWDGTPTITEIGGYAFAGCAGTSITIPDSVTSIGDYAFSECTAKIIWDGTPTITEIGGYAFAGCAGTSIIIPDSVTNIEDYAFSKCTAEIIWDGTPTITEIGRYAFAGYAGTSITIPASVASIGGYAFYNCGSLTSITIPDSVTSIGSYAFYNCTSLTTVTIGNGVTSIGINAFYNCTASLESLIVSEGNTKYHSAGNCMIETATKTLVMGCKSSVIPDDGSVTSIGSSAFLGCTSLTSVTIPDSVTSIGSSAFGGCNSLESMTIPFVGAEAGKTAADTYQYPFGYIFGTSSYTGGTAVEQYYYGSSTSSTTSTTYYIPSSLRSVTVTGGNILRRAFYNCSMLTSVTIPDSVTSIGEYAFNDCTSLTSVTIGNGVTSIEDDAFYRCTGLTSIHYTGNMASWLEKNWHSNVMSSGRALYIGGTKIEGELVIPSGTASIPSYAFAYQTGITSVTIPDGVTSVGGSAFQNCTSLTSVAIPDSVTSIEGNAFSMCASLTSVTIPDSVTSIGGSAFNGCYKLIEVYNKSSLGITAGSSDYGYVAYYAENVYTEEGGSWFTDTDDGLRFLYDGETGYLVAYYGDETALTLPESFTAYDGTKVTSYQIYDYAFYGRDDLTAVTIPSSVTRIGSSAFRNCASLTSVTIPDSVTSIGDYAFSGCSSLTSVTIGDGVTSIGDYAFSGCTALTSITIPDSVTSIGDYAFRYCTAEIIWGGTPTITGISSYAFAGYAGTSIAIPDSVTNIGEYAFDGCDSLTSVTIPDGVTGIRKSAFSGCSSLTSVTIPDSVTSIGDYAFFDCDSLTSVTIPDSVTRIGQQAFDRCSSLTSVTIGNGVTSIGTYAFSYCTSLTSVTFNGTKAEWNAVDKGSYWSYNCPFTEVKYLDGNVSV